MAVLIMVVLGSSLLSLFAARRDHRYHHNLAVSVDHNTRLLRDIHGMLRELIRHGQ